MTKRTPVQSITFYLQRIVGGILALEIALMVIYIGAFYAPTFFSVQPYTILTGSMEPTIPVGSEVYIGEDLEKYPIQVNDIIAFNQDGLDYPVVHRVIAETESTYTTQGDANTGTETVSKTDVLGRCICHIPELGNIGIKANDYKTQFLFITGVTIVLTFVVSRAGNNKPNQQPKKSS